MDMGMDCAIKSFSGRKAAIEGQRNGTPSQGLRADAEWPSGYGWRARMKKLFTNDYIIVDNYLSDEVCQRWEKKILSHLDIFGADVEPAYGQMAAYYGMIEAGLN